MSLPSRACGVSWGVVRRNMESRRPIISLSTVWVKLLALVLLRRLRRKDRRRRRRARRGADADNVASKPSSVASLSPSLASLSRCSSLLGRKSWVEVVVESVELKRPQARSTIRPRSSASLRATWLALRLVNRRRMVHFFCDSDWAACSARTEATTRSTDSARRARDVGGQVRCSMPQSFRSSSHSSFAFSASCACCASSTPCRCCFRRWAGELPASAWMPASWRRSLRIRLASVRTAFFMDAYSAAV
mmetsp:Transcript_27575/g.64675  ORF Transcript_27575/g.64675 Transcript_27575/m.64675 type:complete len:248 (-) Transcript_27575:897-1640(-)